ncbi:hypothetical protein MPK64_gp087 [Erwinia phage pEa_SNUABM_16]|uniref:Uncharacterized protein n=1 Tax=Erwinia phage pEa_SNUABM_16 TaxID=2869544 RepID=A0AAE8XQX9_9CAUD|nr:hypothetical protein MPK64_gp087 [Erwinia phage pEa_SNUABM_16]QZE58990.1 hypothetical protein pEaSNUABM18_00087 [Erwinia phage pEa_SNUABM_18]UAW96231.1 hypothetical protein pEaSNUABM16_00087 [Erwinia phage pEa_SNUABM_16]
MFVPVVTYDPDMFADFVFVMSQIEVSSDSQPQKRVTNESVSAINAKQIADVAQVAYTQGRLSWIQRTQISSIDQIALVGLVVGQVVSKFMARSFTSNLAAPRIDVPLVSGQFATTQSIDPLFDNIVFRVTVGSLDLSDTKANNKSAVPVVS